MNRQDRTDIAAHFARILNIQDNETVLITYPRSIDRGFPKPGKLARAFAKALETNGSKPTVMYNRIYPDYLSLHIAKNEKAGEAANDNKHPTRPHPLLILPVLNKKFAQAAGVSEAEASRIYKDLLLKDYNKMARIAQPLHKLMESADRVHIKGQETDISFSIKNIGACTGRGDINCPDGEVWTAPVLDSVNGVVRFGPSSYAGKNFSHIKVEIKDGKAITATAKGKEETQALNQILDQEGARHIGEFAIAFNPDLLNPTGSILLDEKIKGSFHMAFGRSLEGADNGNRSAVHWDMVQIQRPEFGGGEIWIDDRLIRKDGIFVVPELEALNPKNLKAALSTANDNNKPDRKPKRGPDFKLG